ncbi:MAG: HAD family phosphatase [Clostridia bacterium]|nr:HAD family phosphatase [Clostridia bacterium]
MSKIKAVIFDMDGVLIDAKEWHYEALNRALSLFGYEISRYDHLFTYDGLPTRKKLQMLTLDRGLPSSLHSFINELKQMYTMEIVHARCKPLFQHEFALSALKTNGYKLAVASNSIRHSIEVMMQKSNLIQYLDLIMSNEDVKAAKPDPEIYERTISKLDLTPVDCLVLEDNENGIKAAKAAGTHVMIINSVSDVCYDNISSEIKRIEELIQ